MNASLVDDLVESGMIVAVRVALHLSDIYGDVKDDRTIYQVGDTLPASYVWVDGDNTDEQLDGTSGLWVRSGADLASALEIARKVYSAGSPKAQVLLISGYEGHDGEDDGEVIIKDAQVVAVL